MHERRIRELIEAEYPEAYLGAMPIMLSSEVVPKRWEYTRTNTAVLNAYLHQSMWEELSGMGDELRDAGYTPGIMMVHNTGGMAEVYRTVRRADLQRRAGRGPDRRLGDRQAPRLRQRARRPTWAARASTSGSSSRARRASTSSARSSTATGST